jgi:hypothetical protein
VTQAHPLANGTVPRLLGEQQDSGDFSDRFARAGSVGFIGKRSNLGGGYQYAVQFYPSGVIGFWEPGEIDQGTDVLGNPKEARGKGAAVPTQEMLDPWANVHDVLYAAVSIDEEARNVRVKQDVLDRIREAASITAGLQEAAQVLRMLGALPSPSGSAEVEMTFTQVNNLIGAVHASERIGEPGART